MEKEEITLQAKYRTKSTYETVFRTAFNVSLIMLHQQHSDFVTLFEKRKLAQF